MVDSQRKHIFIHTEMIKSIHSLRDGGSIIIESYIAGRSRRHKIDYSIESKNKGKWLRENGTLEESSELIKEIKRHLKEHKRCENNLIDKALEA